MQDSFLKLGSYKGTKQGQSFARPCTLEASRCKEANPIQRSVTRRRRHRPRLLPSCSRRPSCLRHPNRRRASSPAVFGIKVALATGRRLLQPRIVPPGRCPLLPPLLPGAPAPTSSSSLPPLAFWLRPQVHRPLEGSEFELPQIAIG